MKWVALLLLIGSIQFFPRACEVMALSQSDIYLSSRVVPQGDLGLIKIKVENGEIPQVTWLQKEVHLVSNHLKKDWYGFLGVDLMANPGTYKVAVKTLPSGDEERLGIKIIQKDYGVRRLTLPKHMVDLDAQTLKRVKKESRIMKNLWKAPPSIPRWRGTFLKPVPGDVRGPFGRKSIINDQPRAPHSGVDLKGEREAPIKAINNGRVALTGNHFFTGLTVVIDHGGGIQSMYFHLDKITVKKGEMVTRGNVIGLVGSTGRATGPHLHWGIRINGARVNPLRLTILSTELEE
ncbi:MAG: M23 family metallopeptidase [Desulfatiglandales bacterium]